MNREDRFRDARMVLAANGFNCSGLRGIRFSATREDGSAIAVELRTRVHIKRDNMHANLSVCFPIREEWYLLPHDSLVEIAGETTVWLETHSWRVVGEYNSANPSRTMIRRLEEFKIGASGASGLSTASQDPLDDATVLIGTDSMPGNRWTREQDLAVLYLRKQGLRLSDPLIAELASAMNRTEASIWMRRRNFDSLDPSVLGVGLSHAAQLTTCVWAEYEQDPGRILAEGRDAFHSLLSEFTADRPTDTLRGAES